jgi:hypothetical protein
MLATGHGPWQRHLIPECLTPVIRAAAILLARSGAHLSGISSGSPVSTCSRIDRRRLRAP